jgi:hypothetical protein
VGGPLHAAIVAPGEAAPLRRSRCRIAPGRDGTAMSATLRRALGAETAARYFAIRGGVMR